MSYSANKANVKLVTDYILSSELYSMQKLLADYSLLETATPQGNNLFVYCPYHNEGKPSMSVSTEKNIFKCFSCGRGGNTIDFMVNYETLVKHRSYNYYTFLESLVKADKRITISTGVTTIFTEDEKVRDFSFNRVKSFRPQSVSKDLSYSMLSEAFKGREIEDKKLFIFYMQQGVKPCDIEDSIRTHKKNESHRTSLSTLDIFDLEE